MKMHEWLVKSLRRPMFTGTGRFVPLEADELEADRGASILSMINKQALRKLTLEDVHVRGMNAANDVIDYYDSRFTPKGLREAAKLYPGTAMAAGHDMTRMPLATVFAGDVMANPEGSKIRELRDVGKASWLRGLWYVPRSLSWANDLVEAVDSGVQREVSLHWYFTDARCGLCSNDIRECDHFPGETYDGKRCWYDIEGVTDIVETSFVIKGGQRGTSLWSPNDLQQAMTFGRAIRELKSDRNAQAEYRRAFGPSPNRETQPRSGAARWLGSGRKTVA